MSRRGRRLLVITGGLIVALPVLGLLMLGWMSGSPPSLGVHDGRLAACPDSPNCVCSQEEDEAHKIAPIRFEGTAEQAMTDLKTVIAETPRTELVEQTDTYLHAVVKTRLFRFADDVEFLIDAENRVIHVRAASRVGHSDFGVNRKRIETIRRQFHEN